MGVVVVVLVQIDESVIEEKRKAKSNAQSSPGWRSEGQMEHIR